jgi:hypothetical protein
VIFVVMATGESMTAELAEFVRGHQEAGRVKAVAVCNAYVLAPWADALVCNDAKWWKFHNDAINFAGRKFSGQHVNGCERIPNDPRFPAGCNSGLQGCRIAKHLGATKILLLGVDLHGTHFFGKHPAPLANSDAAKFRLMAGQFKRWRGNDLPPIVNCSPTSALKLFPFSDIREELQA